MNKQRNFIAILLCCILNITAEAGEWVNTVGMTFVDIPAGAFNMGSCRQASPCLSGVVDAQAAAYETPQHRVHIAAMACATHEVTVAQFKQYMTATGHLSLMNKSFLHRNRYGDNAAVVQVSWYEANDFARWLSEQEHQHYRLPTEAEWEYMARAGSTSKWSYSGSPDDYAWYAKNASGHQHPVGQKKPNGFGLYDTTGNVWEWVQDDWHVNYHGAPTDGSAWRGGDTQHRVTRGGGWNFSTKYMRSAYRTYVTPRVHASFIGFRLVSVK
jgi:formylglycine-generating enzyme required for sulfatase activity